MGAAVAGFGYDAATCGDTPPTPVLTFHGTEDGVVPFAGRPPAYADVIPSSGAEPAVEAWAGHNGCGPVAPDEMVSPEVTRRRWTGCRAETVLYIVEGGGHSWPGAEPEPRQGYTTNEISASDVMADFFVRNVRALGP